jgi:transcriptional regulator with XRE-family HTH domain
MTLKRQVKSFDEHIGEKIRDLRIQRGLNQTELGEPLGVSHQQIQKYESGINRLSAGQLWLLCKFLDVPIASLFDGVSVKMVKPRRGAKR